MFMVHKIWWYFKPNSEMILLKLKMYLIRQKKNVILCSNLFFCVTTSGLLLPVHGICYKYIFFLWWYRRSRSDLLSTNLLIYFWQEYTTWLYQVCTAPHWSSPACLLMNMSFMTRTRLMTSLITAMTSRVSEYGRIVCWTASVTWSSPTSGRCVGRTRRTADVSLMTGKSINQSISQSQVLVSI